MSVGFDGAPTADVAVDAEALDLMGDLRRPTVWPARAASVHRVLPSSPPNDGPGGDVVVAGLVAVLARYTGQEEVVVGLSSGGGAVLRVDVADDPGFGELVTRVGAALAAPVARGGSRWARWRWGWWTAPVADAGPEWWTSTWWSSVASDGSGLRVDYAAEGFSAQWVRGLVDQVVVLVSAGCGTRGGVVGVAVAGRCGAGAVAGVGPGSGACGAGRADPRAGAGVGAAHAGGGGGCRRR